jgi:hypothetical protein
MMRLDNQTVKTQEAEQTAIDIARKLEHQALEVEHQILALLQQ